MYDDTRHIIARENQEERLHNPGEQKPRLRHVSRIELVRLYREAHPEEGLGEAKQLMPSSADMERFARERGLTLESVGTAETEEHSIHQDAPASSMPDDELREAHDFQKALLKSHEDDEATDTRREGLMEAFEDEMEHRKLDDYAHLPEGGSTHMPPLAAMEVRGSSYIRPDGGTYLRPPENAAEAETQPSSQSGKAQSGKSLESLARPTRNASSAKSDPLQSTGKLKILSNQDSEPSIVTIQEVIKALGVNWKQLLASKQWSKSMKASLNLLQDIHREAVNQTPAEKQKARVQRVSAAEVPYGLTSETLFYALLLHGLQSQSSKSSKAEATGQFTRMLVEAGEWTETDVRERIKQSFLAPSLAPNSKIRFQLVTPGLAAVIEAAAHLVDPANDHAVTRDGIVGSRHLLIALIQQAQGVSALAGTMKLPLTRDDGGRTGMSDLLGPLKQYLGSHQRAKDDRLEIWNAMFAELGERLEGHGLSATRFSKDEELGLNVKQTAEAVAEIFQAARPDSKAPSEFIFALYGEWGRGKTTLIKKVAEELKKDGYLHILFSAWKYPTRPEVWVHLYERIREHASDGSFRQRLRISFRLGVLDSGWTPLLLGLAFIFGSTLLPATEKNGLWGLLGYGGALLSGTFFLRTTSFGKLLAQRYLKAPDHSDKLGLQAVIGRDLKNLLRVWVEDQPESKPSPKMEELPDTNAECERRHLSKIDFQLFARGWWGAMVASILCLGIASTITLKSCTEYSEATAANQASSRPKDAPAAPDPLMDSTYLSAVTTPTSFSGTLFKLKPQAKPPSFPWEVMVTALGAALVAVIYLGMVTRPLRRQKMLLLTVDDLDRCEPAQMLAVVDSLRLFVDDDAMSRRMQVAMLMDRNLLEKALLNRASESKMSPKPGEEWRFCQVQREKLFVCELEMPALDAADRKEIVDKLLPTPVASEAPKVNSQPPQTAGPGTGGDSGVSNEERQPPPPQSEDSHDEPVPDSGTSTTTTQVTSSLSEENDPTNKPIGEEPSDLQSAPGKAYHDKEIIALRKAIEAAPAHLLTPRSIRMIKIRFELARLLLKKRAVSASPESVAALILRRFASQTHGVYTGGTAVERIVAHVTCDSPPEPPTT